MSPEKALTLVFDLGLTNCKAIVFSQDGKILARATAAYPTYYPSKGEVEQDPDEWWQAVCSTAHKLWENHPDINEKIDSISITGHMHALVCLGREGRTFHRALVLGDQRSVRAADQITQSLSLTVIYQLTGARMDASMPAAKIRWLKDHNNEAHKETLLFTGCKDYIRHLLTGDRLTDPIDACAMSLYNIKLGCWSTELMAEAGIHPGQLPEISEATRIAGGLQTGPARELGLPSGIPVVVGGGDDIEVLGNSLMTAGRSLEHLGTTGSILTVSAFPVYDPEMVLELYPHAQSGLWVVGGSITTAGAALEWTHKILGYSSLEEAFATLDIKEIRQMDDELIFLPHLLGERSPSWQPYSRGTWIGMTTRHTHSDLMRSAFIGTVFALKQILERIELLTGQQNLVTVSAQPDENENWLKLRANIYQRQLALLQSQEPTALGAMILAAGGTGKYSSLEEAVQKVANIEKTIEPDLGQAEIYRQAYDLYRRAQDILRPYWIAGRSPASNITGD